MLMIFFGISSFVQALMDISVYPPVWSRLRQYFSVALFAGGFVSGVGGFAWFERVGHPAFQVWVAEARHVGVIEIEVPGPRFDLPISGAINPSPAPYEQNIPPTERDKTVAMVMNMARQYDVSPVLAYGIAQVESTLQPEVVSSRGAVGLFQVVPHTAGREVFQTLGYEGQPRRSQLKDPEFNTRIAIQYLIWLSDHLYQHVGPSVTTEMILAAYNAGPTRVRTCLQRHGTHGQKWRSCLPRETRTYLRRIDSVVDGLAMF